MKLMNHYFFWKYDDLNSSSLINRIHILRIETEERDKKICESYCGYCLDSDFCIGLESEGYSDVIKRGDLCSVCYVKMYCESLDF